MQSNEMYHDEIAVKAVCLCGRPVQSHRGRGRSGKYCSDRCRQRAKRLRDRGGEVVTKIHEPVTKISESMIADERERMGLQSELLELGQVMAYRRVILPPVFIEPGIDGWLDFAMKTDMVLLRRVLPGIRVYCGHLRHYGL